MRGEQRNDAAHRRHCQRATATPLHLLRIFASPGVVPSYHYPLADLRLPPALRENHLIITVHAAAMGESAPWWARMCGRVPALTESRSGAAATYREHAPLFSRTRR